MTVRASAVFKASARLHAVMTVSRTAMRQALTVVDLVSPVPQAWAVRAQLTARVGYASTASVSHQAVRMGS